VLLSSFPTGPEGPTLVLRPLASFLSSQSQLHPALMLAVEAFALEHSLASAAALAVRQAGAGPWLAAGAP
jgi:hypothetical protein